MHRTARILEADDPDVTLIRPSTVRRSAWAAAVADRQSRYSTDLAVTPNECKTATRKRTRAEYEEASSSSGKSAGHWFLAALSRLPVVGNLVSGGPRTRPPEDSQKPAYLPPSSPDFVYTDREDQPPPTATPLSPEAPIVKRVRLSALPLPIDNPDDITRSTAALSAAAHAPRWASSSSVIHWDPLEALQANLGSHSAVSIRQPELRRRKRALRAGDYRGILRRAKLQPCKWIDYYDYVRAAADDEADVRQFTSQTRNRHEMPQQTTTVAPPSVLEEAIVVEKSQPKVATAATPAVFPAIPTPPPAELAKPLFPELGQISARKANEAESETPAEVGAAAPPKEPPEAPATALPSTALPSMALPSALPSTAPAAETEKEVPWWERNLNKPCQVSFDDDNFASNAHEEENEEEAATEKSVTEIAEKPEKAKEAPTLFEKAEGVVCLDEKTDKAPGTAETTPMPCKPREDKAAGIFSSLLDKPIFSSDETGGSLFNQAPEKPSLFSTATTAATTAKPAEERGDTQPDEVKPAEPLEKQATTKQASTSLFGSHKPSLFAAPSLFGDASPALFGTESSAFKTAATTMDKPVFGSIDANKGAKPTGLLAPVAEVAQKPQGNIFGTASLFSSTTESKIFGGLPLFGEKAAPSAIPTFPPSDSNVFIFGGERPAEPAPLGLMTASSSSSLFGQSVFATKPGNQPQAMQPQQQPQQQSVFGNTGGSLFTDNNMTSLFGTSSFAQPSAAPTRNSIFNTSQSSNLFGSPTSGNFVGGSQGLFNQPSSQPSNLLSFGGFSQGTSPNAFQGTIGSQTSVTSSDGGGSQTNPFAATTSASLGIPPGRSVLKLRRRNK